MYYLYFAVKLLDDSEDKPAENNNEVSKAEEDRCEFVVTIQKGLWQRQKLITFQSSNYNL